MNGTRKTDKSQLLPDSFCTLSPHHRLPPPAYSIGYSIEKSIFSVIVDRGIYVKIIFIISITIHFYNLQFTIKVGYPDQRAVIRALK